MKKDMIEEILAVRSRKSKDKDRDTAYSDRIRAVANTFDAMDKLDDPVRLEAYRYIPVALTALNEAYFRQVITDIIDYKDQEGQEIPEIKDLKITIGIAHALKGQTLTFGEIFAHSFTYSSLASIGQAFQSVTGKALIEEVKPFFDELDLDDKKTIDEKAGYIIPLINTTYEVRNVICHENAQDMKLEKEKVIDIIKANLYFQCATALCLIDKYVGHKKKS